MVDLTMDIAEDPVVQQQAEAVVASQLGPDGLRSLSPEEQRVAVQQAATEIAASQVAQMQADADAKEQEEDDENLAQLAADELNDAIEAVGRRYFAVVPDAMQHSYRLRADVPKVGSRVVSAMHLLQTDHNVAPVMGRVHLVKPDFGYSDKHFMHDIEGDVNEGQKAVLERSKRGPFRDQGGRSTIMDRSRHIMYRKRSGVFEITVRNGVTNSELDEMISKLSKHRTMQGGSRVTIIKGSRRYRMGDLTDLDLEQLKGTVAECVDQYGICGLEIVEQVPGSGPLYKDNMHTPHYKARTRRKKGILHGGKRRR